MYGLIIRQHRELKPNLHHRHLRYCSLLTEPIPSLSSFLVISEKRGFSSCFIYFSFFHHFLRSVFAIYCSFYFLGHLSLYGCSSIMFWLIELYVSCSLKFVIRLLIWSHIILVPEETQFTHLFSMLFEL